MGYKKFQADQLFNGEDFEDEGKVLIADDQGRIDGIVPLADAGENVSYLEGILTPGLINCHCHLELSHLKNIIPPHTGLIEFLCSVVTKRNFDPAVMQEAIRKAEREMAGNGTVAVGDIGNTADTAAVKSGSSIYWQNFVEVLSFTDEKANQNVEHFKSVLKLLEDTLTLSASIHRSSLVPHAPYSISPATFRLLNLQTENQVISMHNQEHPAEDELYRTGGGDYLRLFRIFGVNQSPFPVTGMSSIRSCLPYFNNGQTILLVHNTYMAEEDIIWAGEYAEKNNLKLVYCFCPNANLYIENRLPPIDLFRKHNCDMVLGTDSYSSNWQLNITNEIGAIHYHHPEIPLATILRWATSNGSKALNWDRGLGSFTKGKNPGIVILSNDLASSSRVL